MRVEFLKDWQRFRVGQVIDHLSGGVIDALVRTKVVRPVPLAAPVVASDPPHPPEPEAPKMTPKKKGK